MSRQIKRYGSRKLYDPTDSRYVSLEEVAGWIRAGEQVQAVDNKTGEDVTAQVLTQVISEESRRGAAALPAHFPARPHPVERRRRPRGRAGPARL